MQTPRLVTLFLSLWLSAGSGGAVAAKPLSSVADLRYGVTLYHYYQDHYLAALTELMVAEARGGIKGHGDNPELMAGGISLAFGMERRAGETFTRLLDGSRPRDVRNAAWFYLGKLRYLRSDWDGAEASLGNIRGNFDDELLQELAALQVNLAIKRGGLERARRLLKKGDRYLGNWLPYVHYNLGVAYSRDQDYETAIRHYAALGKLRLMQDADTLEEHLALNDKALTAAGYTLMLQGLHADALGQFTQVRLESPMSNRALLGYGWAAAQTGDYAVALKPWQALSRRSLVHASTQEAVLAVPYAYEKLGSAGEALGAFLNAENVFQQEIARIDQVLEELQNQALLAALRVSEDSNRNWFAIDKTTAVKPHLSYLTELFASNRFQGSVQELRDLLRMQTRLGQWVEKLDAYQLMLDEREIARGKKLQLVAARQLLQQKNRLVAHREALATRIETIAAERDYLAIASADTASLYEIAERARVGMERLEAAGEDIEDYRTPLRRFRGMLLWTASEAFADHLWENRRTLGELDAALQELERNQQRLEGVINTAPDIEPYRQRLQSARARVQSHSDKVNAAVALAESSLRRQVSEEILSQRRRLRHYLAQARLSVARLYDASLEDEISLEEDSPEADAPAQQTPVGGQAAAAQSTAVREGQP
ncbi:hypothetical protein FKG94_07135 [Exilibacterium tricleocarpae]|uniref:Tetratricopeptide repeat protein n=1 Tax=Exilibacterium tricleocarpae TaxID=2591008 RepID=A0A545TZ68_9GAMM|nr:hypothetical protein [Exilibacterium tricleocarpae]TQV82504.1 hypothetical protein FKG94_07135 [Exilibacterium tricleocarpae]